MKKYQIHTTLSLKHLAMLKKSAEKYGSQQKALELALECLENYSKPSTSLTPEEQLWMHFSGNNMACFIQKEGLKLLLDTANMQLFKDQAAQIKPIESQIEIYYNKPLKDCSLKEVIEGVIINAKMAHWFDTVDYTEEGGFYTIRWTHTLGMNNSFLTEILAGGAFNTYGAKFETTLSERTVFMKVYKNER